MTDADPREQADRLRTNIRKGERDVQFEADCTHLLRMSDNIRLVPSEIGEHRHLKLLRHNTRIAANADPPSLTDFEVNDEAGNAGLETDDDIDELLEEVGLLGACLEYRAATEAVVRWINEEYDNEHTNQDYRTAIRSFGRYREKRNEPPESLDWVPTTTSNDFDPVPSERDLLRYQEEIVPMLEACENPRDCALIAVQFEAGTRGGELYDLRRGDVFDGEYTAGIHVDGKRGERAVHLITAMPYLQNWLNDSRCAEDDDAWLWSKLDHETTDRPSYNNFLETFKGAARRAGVSKDVTPTNFRKSNTRWLVLKGFNQPRIEERQGRKRGSEHTARYMARFGDESNERAYARLHDLEVEPEPEEGDDGPIDCPRCHRETPAHKSHCMWCNFELTYEAAKAREETQEAAVDEMVDAEDMTTRQMFAEFVKFLNDEPHRIPEDAHEFLPAGDGDSSSS